MVVRASLNIFEFPTVLVQRFGLSGVFHHVFFFVEEEELLFRHHCSECYLVGRASTGSVCLEAGPRRLMMNEAQ